MLGFRLLKQYAQATTVNEGTLELGEVFSSSAIGKKRRSELVVGVDGEGIELYDVRSVRLLSSYAVPPQCSFTCPPQSIREKNGRSAVRRVTYCSLSGAANQIQRFREESSQDVLSDVEDSAIFTLGAWSSPVKFLEILLNNPEHSLSLLALHNDGNFRILNGDLSKQIWASTSPLVEGSIEYVASISVAEAQAGILRRREDLLAVLSSGNSENLAAGHELLVLVTRSKLRNTLNLELFKVDVVGSALQSPGVHKILSIPIPEQTELKDNETTFILHKKSGRLYQHGGRYVAVYDMTHANPRTEYIMKAPGNIKSCARLSSTRVLISTERNMIICDIRYQSTEAARSIELDPEEMTTTEKDPGPADTKRGLKFVSYLATLDTVIAVHDRKIVMIETSDSSTAADGRRECNTHGTSISAIGKGHNLKRSKHEMVHGKISHKIGQLVDMTIPKEWAAVRQELIQYVKAKDPESFEKLVKEKVVEPFSARGSVALHSSRHEIDFLMTQIFALAEESSSAIASERRLRVKFFSAATFEWLVSMQLIGVFRIEMLLRTNGKLGHQEKLSPSAIVDALAAYDESLQTLLFYLASQALLSSAELASGIQHGLSRLQYLANSAASKTLTNGGMEHSEPAMNGDTQVNGEMDVDAGETADETEVIGQGEVGAEEAHDINSLIRNCLVKLSVSHNSGIRKMLKKYLLPADLLALVNYTRVELARGGWFSRYSDGFAAELDPIEEAEPRQITVLSKILNCAMDALGTSAWLLDSANLYDIGDSGDTIGYMKAEISAALEGVEEHVYLQGMIHELLLYSKTVQPVLENDRSGMVKPITLSESDGMDNLLPIGLKAEQDLVDPTRMGPGGVVQERSMRDIGRLKSLKVPAYSFERIEI